jgi:hypothetical protein
MKPSGCKHTIQSWADPFPLSALECVADLLVRDPAKWEPALGKDHAQDGMREGTAARIEAAPVQCRDTCR